MGRDLSFWKYKTPSNTSNKTIYTKLSQGEFLECIDEIPIEQIINDFRNEFDDWINQKGEYFENNEEAFQLMVTKQFVRADCYSLSEYSMNKIIDIMLKYDCPLYDAVIDVRFDE